MPIILNPTREKSLLGRHPWIFAGAIHSVDETLAPGATVDLISSEGHFLALASYSPVSQIRARVWTFIDEPVDREFFASESVQRLNCVECLKSKVIRTLIAWLMLSLMASPA